VTRLAAKTPTVSMLVNQPNGTLYVGVTSNLIDRIDQHRTDAVPGFTTCSTIWFEPELSLRVRRSTLRCCTTDLYAGVRAVPMATARQAEPKMDCFVTSFLAMTGEGQKFELLPTRTQLLPSLRAQRSNPPLVPHGGSWCRFPRNANGNHAV